MRASLNPFRWCPFSWPKIHLLTGSRQPVYRVSEDKARSKGVGRVLLLSVAVVSAGSSGCGTPGLPRAPSLELPEPVVGLTAVRIADVVTLRWTTPQQSTDKLVLRGLVGLRVCRAVGREVCGVANTVSVGPKYEPGRAAEFRDTLPAELASASPRLLTYTIELLNHAGKSAGPSNAAHSLSGVSPAPLRTLSAAVRADGVVLRWEPAALPSVDVTAGDGSAPVRLESVVRIHRKVVPSATASSTGKSSASEASTVAKPVKWKLNQHGEMPEVTLLVPERPDHGGPDSKAGIALDATAVSDREYMYSAERVFRVAVEGHFVEMAGPASQPVTVATRDVFPPAVPSGLVALTVPEEHAIDLSWDPGSEADLAGYMVYRRETGGVAARISGEMLIAASYRDTGAVAGRRYFYSVSAIDLDGNESGRSAEVEEGLPAR
ncbi:MAG TPA: fibronectin type III domain-containing protein [Acidisarcina sp.]